MILWRLDSILRRPFNTKFAYILLPFLDSYHITSSKLHIAPFIENYNQTGAGGVYFMADILFVIFGLMNVDPSGII